MRRRDFLSVIGGAVVVPARVWAQAGQAPPQTSFADLRRGVGIFTGNGGTIGYLVNKDGALAVDSQFVNTAEICVAGLKPRAPKGFSVLFNTHHHADHTSGNPVFKPLVSKIIAHENSLAWQKRVAEESKTVDQQAYPTATFTNTWGEHLGDETITARYYGPGHTSGDAVIHFQKANVVHGGDLLFRRIHPRIDGPSGASAVNWISILDTLIKEHGNDTIFVFGHGLDNVTRGNRADVAFFRDYLTAAVEHVRKGRAAGQSKDEVTKIQALKGFEAVGTFSPRLSLESALASIYEELGR